ncbi:hypothetical protein ABPG75_012908 [Micractinium tetrahymenae]
MRGLLLVLAVLAGVARGAIIGRQYSTVVGPTPAVTDDYSYSRHFALDKADPADAPLVAYTEYYSYARVLRFNGTAWNKVGANGVHNGTMFDIRIAGHPTQPGRPVKWWNGSQWQFVAPFQPAASTVADIDYGMAFDVSATLGPIVCYVDRVANYGLTCKQPSRGRWQLLGSAGFSGSSVAGRSLAMGSTPYLAFDDAKVPGRGRVMRYAVLKEQWTPYGPSFSARGAKTISLAINPKTGAPWIAFVGDPPGIKSAPLFGKKLTVVAWNGTARAWHTKTHGSFGEDTLYTSLSFDAKGTPYLAFNCEPLFRRLCVRRY